MHFAMISTFYLLDSWHALAENDLDIYNYKSTETPRFKTTPKLRPLHY